MYKVSIVGASGFLGQHLVRELRNANGVSLRSTNWIDEISNSDIIINLVGKAHDHKGTATQQDFYFANVELTKNIFNEFLKSKAQILIHVSSIAAVEEYESLNPLEEDHPSRPFSHYGKSKREAEDWLLKQSLPYNKKIIILRPPMVHGAGDKGNLGLLYKLISKGVPYPLASFENRRSFLSVENLIFFIQEIIDNNQFLDTGVYHVADDETVSTKEIIEIIKKVKNKKIIDLSISPIFIKSVSKIGDFIPLPLNTRRLKKMTSNLEVSNQKIKNALGIDQLPVSASEGLEKTIKTFK
jgi:nucleoside-diphosphate-sugar epimerase